jgi:hypothetical protein
VAQILKKATPPILFLKKNFYFNRAIRGPFTGLCLVFKGFNLVQLYILPVLGTV